MIHVKFSGSDCEVILAAARALEAAKIEKNKHVKAEEAAKELITRELLQKREINLDLLPDKEFVIVQCEAKAGGGFQDAVKISIKTSARFDSKAFGLLHPDLQEQFTNQSPAKYFDSLLS